MCYNMDNSFYGVNFMENEHLEEMHNEEPITEETLAEDTGYQPRPAWQVWVARIALVLFILVIAMYYINILRGGA